MGGNQRRSKILVFIDNAFSGVYSSPTSGHCMINILL